MWIIIICFKTKTIICKINKWAIITIIIIFLEIIIIICNSNNKLLLFLPLQAIKIKIKDKAKPFLKLYKDLFQTKFPNLNKIKLQFYNNKNKTDKVKHL